MRIQLCICLAVLGLSACSSASSVAGAPSTAPTTIAGTPSMPTMQAPARCAAVSDHVELGTRPTVWVFDGKVQPAGSPCIAVPASGFEVTIDNAFSDTGGASLPSHNFAVYADPSATDQLYASATVTAGTHRTFRVTGVPSGVYVFQCDLHPDSMHGVLVVH